LEADPLFEGGPMKPSSKFANLEVMCRERAALAKREAQHWLAETEYWLREADEWRQLRDAALIGKISNRSNDLAKSN
jgi:hypothetical protein